MAEKPSPTGAYLVALTPESSASIQAKAINVPHLPFRIGRESRQVRWTQEGLVGEKRRSATPNNDLYLVETTDPMNVSREHLQIERDAEGFHLRDRGSACGTLVEGEPVGGDGRGGRVALADHAVFIVGSSASRFVFKFRLDG